LNPTTSPRPGNRTDSGGDFLRRAREARGLTVEQLSQLTKIPRRHLEAIESGDLAVVPGDFYRRAEIKTYARAVNVDPLLALARFEPAPPPPEPPPAHVQEAAAPAPAAAAAAPGHSRKWIAVGIVGAIAVLGFALRGIGPLAGALRADDAVPEPAAVETREPEHSAPAAEQAVPGAVATSQTSLDQERAVATPGAVPAEAGAAEPPVVPSAAPAAVERSTTLVVDTTPAGARVTVDGIGWGVTPVTIRHLPPGAKHVRVSLDGFAAAERSVSVVEGQRRTVSIEMRAAR
jgi:cytoskeletal protein RodZ